MAASCRKSSHCLFDSVFILKQTWIINMRKQGGFFTEKEIRRENGFIYSQTFPISSLERKNISM